MATKNPYEEDYCISCKEWEERYQNIVSQLKKKKEEIDAPSKDLRHDKGDGITFYHINWHQRYLETLSELNKLKEDLSIKYPSIHRMPEYLKPKDLVALGFYSSVQTIYIARREGKGFPFVKVDGSIFYHKSDVLRFIKEKTSLRVIDKDI